MSAFSVHFRRDRIIVGTDTLAYAPDRRQVKPLGFISKIVPIPHVHAVIFGRGMASVIFRAALNIMISPNLADIEDAAIALVDILRAVTDDYAADQGVENWGDVGIAEVILAGWSERSQRMRLFELVNTRNSYAFESDNGANSITTTPALPPHLTPKIDGLTVDQQVIALIKAERDLFEAEPELAHGASVGGEIIAWKIEPAAISQRTLYRFQDYERVKNAAAAVFARFSRGDDAVDLNEALIPAGEMVAGEEVPQKPKAEVATLAPGASRAERRRAERAARRAASRAA